MREISSFYVNGRWVVPFGTRTMEVENPATGEAVARLTMGNAADVDRAVAAARAAFETFSRSTREDRLALLERVEAAFVRRREDFARAITEEMGAPITMARNSQVQAGFNHIGITRRVLERFSFSEVRDGYELVREPIGVCAMITPWNWPLNQVLCKVAPALATGCTMILKPSEITPTSAQILAEVMDEAGVPAGVFNLVQGDGPETGSALSAHPDVDLVSFTGSTRAGTAIAASAAATVKRVLQELGGKSPNIIFDDDGLDDAVRRGVMQQCYNSGQSCNAPSRMLVPRRRLDDAIRIAAATAATVAVGDPLEDVAIGPVSSRAQYEKIQRLIRAGIDEHARLVAGGLGLPDGLTRGYYIRPTVFADVTNEMVIAREEIFGPVLSIIAYDDIGDAVAIANDSEYGLAAYVNSTDSAAARAVASQLRAGQVQINGAAFDQSAPFGGYKRSGNGREGGEHGFYDYLETKAVLG